MTADVVETWKGIAVALKRSDRWCRDMAVGSHDPLPVYKVGGIVRLNLADLDAWIDRQRAATLRPDAIAADPVRGPAPEEHW